MPTRGATAKNDWLFVSNPLSRMRRALWGESQTHLSLSDPPPSLSPTRHSLLVRFHKHGVGKCKNTKTRVSEPMGGHCRRLNTVCVLTKALFFVLSYMSAELRHRHWNDLQLDISTVAAQNSNQLRYYWKSRVVQVVMLLWYHTWKQTVSALWLKHIVLLERDVTERTRASFKHVCPNCVWIWFVFIRTGSAHRIPGRHRPQNISWRVELTFSLSFQQYLTALIFLSLQAWYDLLTNVTPHRSSWGVEFSILI